MKISKLTFTVLVSSVICMTICSGYSYAGVSPEEAAQLGKTLTLFGAEKAGNKEGTIPPYTGGLTKVPATYVQGSGWRPDPYESDKPLFSIDAKNMADYAGKLTEGTKSLMKKYSTFRIDVYQSRRSAAFPESVLENTVMNATRASTLNGGLSVKGPKAGFPFPIPKNGYEVMWNHNMRYQGKNLFLRYYSDYVDATGKMYNVSEVNVWESWPYYMDETDLPLTSAYRNFYWMVKWHYLSPARKAGEGGLGQDPFNIGENYRKAWLYLQGQRRVKLAPQVAFDTPSSDGNGNFTYDETQMFNGSMERYNMKLIGKKEMYIPYNAYRAVYVKSKDGYYSPRHMNPDVLRWELHRVWVVEATLKPGKRHIYPKRVFYIDEDIWTVMAMDCYDAGNSLFKVDFMFYTQNYDYMAPYTISFVVYNLNNGTYTVAFPSLKGRDFVKHEPMRQNVFWTADNLATMGVR